MRCYRPFFKAPTSERVPEPTPLPYIETEYSPLALRRDQHQVLGARSKEFDLVADAFASLSTSCGRSKMNFERLAARLRSEEHPPSTDTVDEPAAGYTSGGGEPEARR